MSNTEKHHPLLKVLKIIGIVLLAVVLGIGVLVLDFTTKKHGGNPYSSILLSSKMEKSLASIKRVDEDGTMYYMDFSGNYDASILKKAIAKFGFMKEAACSCFSAYNENGDYICARNYDLPHKDKDGNITGLNVIVNLTPENGYRSINGCDASWLSLLGLEFNQGALDDGTTNLTPLVILPYLCMDGMNEKGLTLSILSIDVKKGETPTQQTVPGRESMVYPIFMRRALDTCANVDEAIELARNTNFLNVVGMDFHMFAADASGKSCVLECRYNELKVTYTDAATNFLAGWDDAEDCYIDGGLKEAWNGIPETKKEYHVGYGHGYERFGKVITFLDRNAVVEGGNIYSRIKQADALNTLKDVSQGYTGGLTSYTQYSVIYNLKTLEAEVYPTRKWDKRFCVKLIQ